MPSNFWSKIFVESQDSGSDVAKVAQEKIVPTMVDQIKRNKFSNAFDYFQALIEELKNQGLTISQRLEEPMVGKVKAMANRVQQTKV